MVGAAKGGLGRFAGKIYVAENHTNHSEGRRLARWARSCSGKGAGVPESARLLVGTASALPNRRRTSGWTGGRTWLRRRRLCLTFCADFCGSLPERICLGLVAHCVIDLGKIIKASGSLWMFRASGFLGYLHRA